ncbi:MAG: hypothetical protein GF390_00960 [Candidatus Pacebacteria bacterium]|nr:hypothetical protein [Candidatus Paceibacterota bacterium]
MLNNQEKSIIVLMRLIKISLLLVFFVVLGAAGLYYANNKGWLAQTPLANLDQTEIQLLTQDAGNQTRVLSDRAQEVNQHLQQVLGTSVQVNEQENEALHQRAFEYGRYLYCKQVVKEWEEQ